MQRRQSGHMLQQVGEGWEQWGGALLGAQQEGNEAMTTLASGRPDGWEGKS